MSEPYQGEHVTFDGFEMPVSLHCLRCNLVIARRSEAPSAQAGVSLHAMSKGAHYREVYAELSDGSVCYLTFCQDCLKYPVDPEAAMEVIKRGWELALVHQKRPPEAIENQRAKVADLRIVKVGRTS